MNDDIIQLMRIALVGHVVVHTNSQDPCAIVDVTPDAQLLIVREGPRRPEGSFIVNPHDVERYR